MPSFLDMITKISDDAGVDSLDALERYICRTHRLMIGLLCSHIGFILKQSEEGIIPDHAFEAGYRIAKEAIISVLYLKDADSEELSPMEKMALQSVIQSMEQLGIKLVQHAIERGVETDPEVLAKADELFPKNTD